MREIAPPAQALGKPNARAEATAGHEVKILETSFKIRFGFALLLLVLAAIEALIISTRVVPDLTGIPQGVAAGLLSFVYFSTVAAPGLIGTALLLSIEGSPRRIRLGASAADFDFLRRSNSVFLPAVLAYDTSYGLLRGAQICVKTERGEEVCASGLPLDAVSKLVAAIELASPRTPPEEPWAWAVFPGRPKIRDRRPGSASLSGRRTPIGVWCSRTKAARAWLWAALFPEVAGVFITSAFVMLIPSSASLGAIGVAAVLAGIAWLLTVAIGAWQASAISKGWIGDSSLIIPGNGPEAVARAIQGAAALNSARAQTRWSLRLFGFEVRRWRLAAFARATYTVAPSGTWGRITVRTRGLRNVELHQRVKGSILESLERERGAPLQASER